MEAITDVKRPGDIYIGDEREILANMLDRQRAPFCGSAKGWTKTSSGAGPLRHRNCRSSISCVT